MRSLRLLSVVLAVFVLVAAAAVADAPAAPAPTVLPIDLITQTTPLLQAPWFWRPGLSWGGEVHSDSFYTDYESGDGVWDLGLFTRIAPGFGQPEYFQATFGAAMDASQDAVFEVTIWGNPSDSPRLMRFRVDQNHPHIVSVSLSGLYRVEIHYQRLAGYGGMVMIEPKVQF